MTANAYALICIAEDAWTWLALLCGNHAGLFSTFPR